MIHQPLSPDGGHHQMSSSQRLLVLCLVRSTLFIMNKLLFVYFLKKTHFFYRLPLTNATPALINALILLFICYQYQNVAQKPALHYSYFYSGLISWNKIPTGIYWAL